MSSDSSNNQNDGNMNRNRRGSVTQAALGNLFQRSNSTSAGTPAFPSAAMNMNNDRRRMSINTLGISGTSPTTAGSVFTGMRRGSISTNSDSIDENAIDEDDFSPSSNRTAPTTPFTRRMSFGAQAMRNLRTGGGSPGSNDQGFNWSEQLRSRAESTVQGSRPTFSLAGLSSSPPRAAAGAGHERAKSVSEMPQPPAQAPKPKQPERQKPDAFQERILKGDFYMD
jgi:hypothetical protein